MRDRSARLGYSPAVLPERRHDISRLDAFSDALFAFALTLLVVALEVPNYGARSRRRRQALESASPRPSAVASG